MEIKTLYTKLCVTTVFRRVLDSALLKAFFGFCKESDREEKLKHYALFVSEIYEGGGSLTELCKKLLFEDENVYVKTVASGNSLDENVLSSAKKELETFALFACLAPENFALEMGVSVDLLPSYASEKRDFVSEYERRLKEIEKYGYGIFSSSVMFRLSDEKKIEPIGSADKIGMESFIGYEREREKVVENTLAFLEGRPAANVLLCGDAGTGKSSTVKAVVNEFFDRGLRLIELRKDQLDSIPKVMGQIRENPLKFVVFIDDLSFNQNDDNFSMLKAALEGSAAARADNAVIYATSNRRHIVKENFSDRSGDDVHRNDTLQETLSLSERFGLVVFYARPDKKLYLQIVRELAKRRGIEKDTTALEIEAEAFALKRGTRSARAAEQFIDSLS